MIDRTRYECSYVRMMMTCRDEMSRDDQTVTCRQAKDHDTVDGAVPKVLASRRSARILSSFSKRRPDCLFIKGSLFSGREPLRRGIQRQTSEPGDVQIYGRLTSLTARPKRRGQLGSGLSLGFSHIVGPWGVWPGGFIVISCDVYSSVRVPQHVTDKPATFGTPSARLWAS
eukprot:scaffold423191_cov18-Prasinocladus_malaysianus.AAC.1